jgi:anti-sigma factor RsiW
MLRLARRDYHCQQVVELITDYLEDALSGPERRRLERHLAACPHCTEYLAQIEATIAVAGRVTAGDITGQMRADLLEVYRRWRQP